MTAVLTICKALQQACIAICGTEEVPTVEIFIRECVPSPSCIRLPVGSLRDAVVVKCFMLDVGRISMTRPPSLLHVQRQIRGRGCLLPCHHVQR